MKKMKKILSTVLVATMVMSIPAFAAQNQEASFKKTYVETYEDSVSPEETFTFTFTAANITDSNKNLKKEDMPSIPNSTVTFSAGDAATEDGLEKNVEVALSNVVWPGVGVYYYTVSETEGTTAGVKYDDTVANLKVTVAYDQGTNTYYTAFVTLSLADEKDNVTGEAKSDGITDTKLHGFENVYTAGSLTVQKKVEGNMADQEKEFKIDVKFTAPADKDVREDITFTGNGDVYSVEGETLTKIENGIAVAADKGNSWDSTTVQHVVVEVAHDEYVTFSNIPNGVTYTVVERDYTTEENGAYEEAKYNYDADEDDKTESTLTIDDAADKVVITNTKGVVVDTGISLDNMPYIMMLAMAVLGAFGFVSKKRKEEEMF